MKILLVDDSATIRRMYNMLLPKILEGDLEILEAENGKEALDRVAAADGEIDLIFLDVNMPEMKGDEFLKIFRSNKENKNTRVIMSTTEAEKKFVISMMKIGANGYIVKPFNHDSVYKMVSQVAARAENIILK